MTIPYERTRALIRTKELLTELTDSKLTPRVPAILRRRAQQLLKHYPSFFDIERAHKELPEVFGPVPPFSRLCGTQDTLNVIEATKAEAAGSSQ